MARMMGSIGKEAPGMRTTAAEALEEVNEAETPGARGHEYRDDEREGDMGQPYKRGGGMCRDRGGYMPEETEASAGMRTQPDKGKAMVKSMPAPDKSAGMESYRDERKRGGRISKRAGGGGMMEGVMDGAAQHRKSMPDKMHHVGRKSGGSVPGKGAKSRPDRKARSGSTADLHPMTAAGNVSVPDYQKQFDLPQKNAAGGDSKGPYGKSVG